MRNLKRFERLNLEAGLSEFQGYLIVLTMAFIFIEAAYWAVRLIYLGVTS